MYTMDVTPAITDSSFPHAGTYCPQASKPSVTEFGSPKMDPSSESRADKYPIPSFFEYRVNADNYEVL